MKTADQKYVAELIHAAIVASMNYDIWRTYNHPEIRPKFVDVMNRYLDFFSTSIHAHFVALLLPLYRLYETRSDTHNIPALLDRLEKKRPLPQKVKGSIQKKYGAAKPLWAKVGILRNKVFAHHSQGLSTEEVFAQAKISPDQIKELLDITKELLNELSENVDYSIDAFNIEAKNDTLRLLTVLDEHAKAL